MTISFQMLRLMHVLSSFMIKLNSEKVKNFIRKENKMRKTIILKKWTELKILFFGTLALSGIIAFAPLAQAAPTMKSGSSGDDVVTLQRELVNLGYSFGPIDGIYGSKTIAAVEAFQQNDHLQVDGIAGPLTQRALEKGQTLLPTSTNSSKISGIMSKANSLIGSPYLWGGQPRLVSTVLVLPNTFLHPKGLHFPAPAKIKLNQALRCPTIT